MAGSKYLFILKRYRCITSNQDNTVFNAPKDVVVDLDVRHNAKL